MCFCISGDEDGGPGFVGIVLSFDTKRLTAQAGSKGGELKLLKHCKWVFHR